MARIELRGSPELAAALRRLTTGSGTVVAESLRKTMFEMKEAEEIHIRASFDFAGAGTENFLARSIRFTPIRPGQTSSTLFALPASDKILAEHDEGAQIRADNTRLELGSSLAAPVGVKRGGTGKVPTAQSPGKLLAAFGTRTKREPRSRKKLRFVFVSRSGKALVEAVRGQLRVLYALIPGAKLTKRLRFHAVAERTARTELPRKVIEAFEKQARRSAARR